MKSYQPLSNRVLIKPIVSKVISDGGIHIPGVAQEKPVEGVVVATGRGTPLDGGRILPVEVKVGDTVVFEWAGIEPVNINGEVNLLMRESSIVAIVTEKE